MRAFIKKIKSLIAEWLACWKTRVRIPQIHGRDSTDASMNADTSKHVSVDKYASTRLFSIINPSISGCIMGIALLGVILTSGAAFSVLAIR